MNTSEKILLIQTIIAVITSGIVGWYTYVTHKLYSQARKQNRIQGEQLELAKRELRQKEEIDRRLSAPLIRWRGGTSSLQDEKWDFQNLGADCYEIGWTAPAGVAFAAFPQGFMKALELGWVHLSGQSVRFPIHFSLRFTTRMGEVWTKKFEIASPQSQPKEIENAAAG